jgi:hypothetical protein
LVLGECHNNYRQAAVLYRNRFPHRRHPNHCTISRLVLRQRQRQCQKRRRRRINVPERDPTVLAVLGMIAINPRVSTRQIERELGIPKSTSHRILTTHNFHPYHITLTQQLTLNDFQQRLEFCRWAQIMLNRDRIFFRFVLFSDEATFHNTGQLNRHNSHYWSVENPRWYREVNHQHRWSLIVWCGILNGNLIGPYFFDENVNGNNYLHFLQQRLPALLEDIDLDTRQRMFFQQDGAPAHWSRIVRNHLNLTFPGRWIGRGGPVSWCPRSPDLSSLDFFLWGYLKNVVYSETPTTRENMMERITLACRSIPRNILLLTVDSFERRVQLCVDNNGQIFEHLLRS